ncbi:MAG TPA: symmetrical bis(5'-nucleosyl)-tetraphosphatase [Steroidobacteraceae bacterium]|nr:symmetrical bis(5'-nucleosyl)-tetraphosphatase [Steroidobacteraceae bacterium]
MARYAIGDVQGCHDELLELLARLRFNADRDRLTFVGDLVNRGPQSLQVLRHVKSLGAAAQCVLGNHDLHLLAHHFDPHRKLHRGDTLQAVLGAPDRAALMEWLLALPLAIHDAARNELVVHAGLVPQWSAADAAEHGARAGRALREDPEKFLAGMYGNEPDTWSEDLKKKDRLRFTINVLTRLRYCTAEGRVDLKLKGAPRDTPGPFAPWFSHASRRSAGTRVIFGHWSTLGLLRRNDLLALDTGCVWGGALTAVNLDDPEAPAVSLACREHQKGGD